MTGRILYDRLETDDLSGQADTAGTDMEDAGAALKGKSDEVDAAIQEAFEAVRPLIEEIVATAESRFTALETRYSDSTNEGAFQVAALERVSTGRTAFQTVLTSAEEDRIATQSAVVQTIADYVTRVSSNVLAPAQSCNADLTNLSTMYGQQQTSVEDLDTQMASRATVG